MVVAAFPRCSWPWGCCWERVTAACSTPRAGPIDYQNLFWFFGHPVVYVMFFPFVGAVAEVDRGVLAAALLRLPRASSAALLLFTALSTSVWAHHMFATGQITVKYFSLTSTALIIPAGIEYLDLVGTMWGGRIRLGVPMPFAIGFILQFLSAA